MRLLRVRLRPSTCPQPEGSPKLALILLILSLILA
jgi:hypothetical protein